MKQFKTLKELLEHNKQCEAARQMKKDLKKEPEHVEVVEETPHVVEAIPEIKEELPDENHEEEILIEEECEKEEIENKVMEVVEDPAPKKRGRKPANREYMVVENIEEVNKD